jgi:hypothetical protein
VRWLARLPETLGVGRRTSIPWWLYGMSNAVVSDVAQTSLLGLRPFLECGSWVAQTPCFSESAAFCREFADKPQSLQRQETLRYPWGFLLKADG